MSLYGMQWDICLVTERHVETMQQSGSCLLCDTNVIHSEPDMLGSYSSSGGRGLPRSLTGASVLNIGVYHVEVVHVGAFGGTDR